MVEEFRVLPKCKPREEMSELELADLFKSESEYRRQLRRSYDDVEDDFNWK